MIEARVVRMAVSETLTPRQPRSRAGERRSLALSVCGFIKITPTPPALQTPPPGSVRDRGASAVLTFWPSEFSQLRTQYRRTRYGDNGRVANELLLQALFTIGAHGAYPF